MGRTVLISLLSRRRGSAVEFQKIITEYGCIVKTRLGIHDGVLDKCSDEGLIIMELAGERAKIEELRAKLDALNGVATSLVDIAIANG
jgi:hypothetical protein